MKIAARLGIVIVALFAIPAFAQRQMERLTRGVVAVNQGDGSVFVSWRLLGTDSENTAFDLYRSTSTGQAGSSQQVKLNDRPIADRTWFRDVGADPAQDNLYFVRTIIEQGGGRIWVESEPGSGTCFWFTVPRAPLSKRPVPRTAADASTKG